MEWFLRERYVRHLVDEGRMDNKIAYLEHKNRVFPSVLKTYRYRLESEAGKLARQEEDLWQCLDSFPFGFILN